MKKGRKDDGNIQYTAQATSNLITGEVTLCALEVINFKREVIRLTEEELQNSANADYLMASKRTAALRFI